MSPKEQRPDTIAGTTQEREKDITQTHTHAHTHISIYDVRRKTCFHLLPLNPLFLLRSSSRPLLSCHVPGQDCSSSSSSSSRVNTVAGVLIARCPRSWCCQEESLSHESSWARRSSKKSREKREERAPSQELGSQLKHSSFSKHRPDVKHRLSGIKTGNIRSNSLSVRD